MYPKIIALMCAVLMLGSSAVYAETGDLTLDIDQVGTEMYRSMLYHDIQPTQLYYLIGQYQSQYKATSTQYQQLEWLLHLVMDRYFGFEEALLCRSYDNGCDSCTLSYNMRYDCEVAECHSDTAPSCTSWYFADRTRSRSREILRWSGMVLSDDSDTWSEEVLSLELDWADEDDILDTDGWDELDRYTADEVVYNPEIDDTTVKQRYLVVRVIDGDTFILLDEEGKEVRVRLIWVDTPESVHPSKIVESGSLDAASYLRSWIGNKYVTIEFDVQQLDYYGRRLVYAYDGSQMINEQILLQWYGKLSTVPPNVQYVDRFRSAQELARTTKSWLRNVQPININTADLASLMTIKHITQSRAEQLMTLRPFSSIQDMKRISGIGDARIADIIEQGVAYME